MQKLRPPPIIAHTNKIRRNTGAFSLFAGGVVIMLGFYIFDSRDRKQASKKVTSSASQKSALPQSALQKSASPKSVSQKQGGGAKGAVARREGKKKFAAPRVGAFALHRPYPPAGDQPQAIEKLSQGVLSGMRRQTLLGVTGSGKTYTMANVIARCKRPTMVIAPNKTLAAQLYAEFREFFPDNAVEYFVSYYDYYQPEAYVPARDLFIEKDSSINEHIEQMRLSATKSLMERRDCVIVATVSAIYGIGDPVDYHSMILHLREGEKIPRTAILRRLAAMLYERDKADFCRGAFRVRGDVIDIFPAENSELALRISLDDERVESLLLFDPLTGAGKRRVMRYTVYPSSHYAAPRENTLRAVAAIKEELQERLAEFRAAKRDAEAARLEQRTKFDLEMMQELGFCKGIENYSRHLSGRAPGEPPPTLFDYLPADALLIVDESHVTIPQLGGMFRGDRARKENLVEYGFRLPSALDNRPLRFEEFERLMPGAIFASATPAEYERAGGEQIVEQLVRPTGLVDPAVAILPAQSQVDDLLAQVRARAGRGERVLATTLTKRMAEQLSEFLAEHGVKVRYMHSDIDTVERAEIIRDLRLGKFDALIGINLLREGLDLPEVSLVAILDADKEGFLRSERSLIQTIGRAARHISGEAILYADAITASMKRAIAETERRRERQLEFNRVHNITPRGVHKKVKELLEGLSAEGEEKTADKKPRRRDYRRMSEKALGAEIRRLEKLMTARARDLQFERAADLRDEIRLIRKQVLGGEE